jgi:anti-sigma factor RsiW
MKREIIERLAIDSAAGELNEDVEALFRAFLAEHPEASPDSEEMARIYEETAAAIEAKTRSADAVVVMPAVKANRLPYLKWRSFGRWAAVLIVGALIGFTGGRWATTGETSRVAFIKPERPAEQVKTLSDLKEEYAGTFWGDKVLVLLESSPAQRHRAEFRDVGFWQKYRKEIRYE